MQPLKIVSLTVLVFIAVAFGYYLNEPQETAEKYSSQQNKSIQNQSVRVKEVDDREKLPTSKNNSVGKNDLNGKSTPENNSSGIKAKNRTVPEKLSDCGSREDTLEKISCYQKILAKNPENAPANYLLAAAYMKNADLQKADEHFALFWKYATRKQKQEYNIHVYTDLKSIKETLSRLESDNAKSGEEFGIPYKTINKHIVVEVVLNRSLKANMILDTGASITVLSPEIANRLQLENRGSITLQTIAEDELQASLYSLPSLSLGDLEKKDVPVATAKVRAIQSTSIDGILGMDFFEDHSFRINRSDKEIVFQ